MKNKNIFSFLGGFILLCFFAPNMNAQESNEPSAPDVNVQGSFGPSPCDVMVSIKLGSAIDYGQVYGYEVNSVTTGTSTSDIYYPAMSTDNTNATFFIVGVEAKYFLSSKMAVALAAGGAKAGVPSQDFVPGVAGLGNSSIMNYSMLEGVTNMQMYLDLGFDYYFTTRVSRVFPYVGGELNGVYSQMQIFDGFRGVDPITEEVINTFDTRRGESYAFGGGIKSGVDYYVAEGMFIGLEVKAASYMYAAKSIFSQPGVSPQQANSHNFAFLSQPMIKLGFKF